MKKGIHPKYYQAKVTCTCGAEWTVGSTKKEIRLDVCSSCHPFFTGKQKVMDTEGRVERFRRRYGIKDKTSEALEKNKK
ncbi:MAG: 50S ribosomal protein L31 [Candidatus Zixiibacteriota bacterium]